LCWREERSVERGAYRHVGKTGLDVLCVAAGILAVAALDSVGQGLFTQHASVFIPLLGVHGEEYLGGDLRGFVGFADRAGDPGEGEGGAIDGVTIHSNFNLVIASVRGDVANDILQACSFLHEGGGIERWCEALDHDGDRNLGGGLRGVEASKAGIDQFDGECRVIRNRDASAEAGTICVRARGK
jgi:hypothetical protein